jgi:cell division protein FtsW (lipid II flippase)
MKKIFFIADWLTILPVLAISIIGFIILISFNINDIYPVNQNLIIKHAISIFLGLFSSIIISKIDYRVFSIIIQPLFFGISTLLGLVLIFGDRINGAKSWFYFGPFNMQPGEFAKIVVVLIIAHYFTRYHHKINSFISIILSLIPVIIIILLILLQPDFGTAVILLLIWLGMLVFGGIKLQHIIVLMTLGTVCFSFFWAAVFQDYQKERILTFLNPTSDPLGSGYNVLQSMRSVSSGGLTGVNDLAIAVPEIHTDFIFSGLAQKWGFVGVSIYFTLILLIIARLIYLCVKSQDTFPRMIILGVILSLLIQSFINIGMNIGFLPITGVPLPFISYGGSSMLVYWILIGLVLSIQNHKLSQGTIFMKDTQDIFG